MKSIIYTIPMLLAIACSSSRPGQSSGGATVKRTTGPAFIESISMTPGEEGPGANNYPNTGALAAPANSGIPGHLLNIENSTGLQFKYAILLNDNVENMNNLALLQFIDDWYGTRYRYGGSTKQGIDCSAFVNTLQTVVFGKSVPRTSREQFEQCHKIPSVYLQTGDLVFFNTRGGISHVGVYISNNKFVHASTSSGVMISDLGEAYYKSRFVGAGRP